MTTTAACLPSLFDFVFVSPKGRRKNPGSICTSCLSSLLVCRSKIFGLDLNSDTPRDKDCSNFLFRNQFVSNKVYILGKSAMTSPGQRRGLWLQWRGNCAPPGAHDTLGRGVIWQVPALAAVAWPCSHDFGCSCSGVATVPRQAPMTRWAEVSFSRFLLQLQWRGHVSTTWAVVAVAWQLCPARRP